MQSGLSVTITMPAPGGLDSKQLMDALRRASPLLVEKLLPIIRERTPKRTGALRESLSGQSYNRSVSGNREASLAQFFYEDGPQVQEWKRVYAPYQEGPSLGLSTYTNEPRHMLAQINTTDASLVQQWADAAIEEALGEMVRNTPDIVLRG
jgi:hypothetical protein